MTKEFIAICRLSHTCGSYIRDKDPDTAIQRCKRLVEIDWNGIFQLDDYEGVIEVYDITGHDSVFWDNSGVHPASAPTKVLDAWTFRKVKFTPKKKHKT